jgi:hypothetical protein
MDLELVQRFDLAQGEVTARRRTQTGGLVAKARLTKTGIFDYTLPDGSVRRELRPASEVFHPDSLATYPHAPVTVDHPGKVTPANWKSVSVGHVADAAQDGDFVSGELHIQDAGAIAKAEAGKLKEISCGYECALDRTPGTYLGQPYDAVQRNIRINHVAAGPAGWGRMGPDVRMNLDSACGVSVPIESEAYLREHEDSIREAPMTEDEKKALADAIAKAKAADDALVVARKDAADAKDESSRAKAKLVEDAAESTKLRAENEVLRLQVKRMTEDAAESKSKGQLEAQVEATIAIREDARRILGATAADPTGSKWAHGGKSNDELKRLVIAKEEPKFTLDSYGSDAASVAAIDAVYQLIVARTSRSDAARGAVQAIATSARADKSKSDDDGDGDTDDAESARKAMIQRQKDAWKKTPKRIDRARSKGAA